MATSEHKIATSGGVVVGKIFDSLEILGIASFVTQTGNLPNTPKEFRETVEIEVPIGTFVVIPALNHWLVGFGQLDPAIEDLLADNGTQTWHTEDHNWGAGFCNVGVQRINAPDFSQNPPRQTAELQVVLFLADDNGDDAWFGVAGYNVLFLGKGPRVPVPTGAKGRASARKISKGIKIG